MKRCLFCMNTMREDILIAHLFSRSHTLCSKCRALIEHCRFDETNRCSYCKGNLDYSGVCQNCRNRKDSSVHFDTIEAQFHYDHFVKTLMHQYKFLNDVAIAEIFASYIRIQRKPNEIIVPMPSSPEHDLQRTFNPVQTILNHMKIPYVTCLKMYSRSKQYTLSRAERYESDNPIYFDGDICLENKTILLIDDIYTTGHTAHCAGNVLLQQKVRKLSMLTFAR
ncbi:ComF family protein [Staphylococcus cornubiensis]|uniref:ComF family protein n=1 Tax=Staphylococcus cornubiensis TaxID=1986155 RepID=UPI000A3D139E|nr:ComF family protein [Staphylococcus cornubiensis]